MAQQQVDRLTEAARRLSDKVEKAVWERSRLEVMLEHINGEKAQVLDRYQAAEELKRIVLEVSRSLRGRAVEIINQIVSEALKAVFGEDYGFEIELVDRRGKTEADLWLLKGDKRLSPLQGAGGGVVDLISFALRLAFWAIAPNRPLMFLDEPFKNLSRDYHEAAAEFLKRTCNDLGVQLVVVTHLDAFIESADRVFEL